MRSEIAGAGRGSYLLFRIITSLYYCIITSVCCGSGLLWWQFDSDAVIRQDAGLGSLGWAWHDNGQLFLRNGKLQTEKFNVWPHVLKGELLTSKSYLSHDCIFHITISLTSPYRLHDCSFHITVLFTSPYCSHHFTISLIWLYLSHHRTSHITVPLISL